MLKQPIIRRFLSGILLVLFAFSVTPKKFLHDLVANHKDTPGKFSKDAKARLQKSTFTCHTEDLVVESPFIGGSAPLIIQAPSLFCPPYAELVTRWHSTPYLFSALRGPPSRA
ncbi:MAG: hypothetical protein ABUM51_05985 [Bacteroidota bacterium]